MGSMDRRAFLAAGAAAAAGWWTGVAAGVARPARGAGPRIHEVFKLPELPGGYADLEPHMDRRTFEWHYAGYHADHVRRLNRVFHGHTELARKGIEWCLANVDDLPRELKRPVRVHGSAHHNHTLFFTSLRVSSAAAPVALQRAAARSKMSFHDLLEGLRKACGRLVGSGWGWIVADEKGILRAISTRNDDSPILLGLTPLFGVDLWEHAWYPQYPNRRDDYLRAVLGSLVDWQVVWDRYAAAFEPKEASGSPDPAPAETG